MRNAVSLAIMSCAALLLGSARSAAAHDGLHEQIVTLTRAIERSPRNAELYLHRAELYRIHRQWDFALADFQRAEALDPRLDGLLLGEARLQRDAGRFDSARGLVERHLVLHAQDPGALLLRAELALQRGAVEQAVGDYDRAIALLDPPEPDHHLARADALASLGPRGVERALAGIDAALAELGPVTSLELRAVELELVRGRFDDALARLDGVAARSRRQEAWLARRGEILLDAGRPAEALEAFGAARFALDSLQARHRSSAANRELEESVACRLAELGAPGASPGRK